MIYTVITEDNARSFSTMSMLAKTLNINAQSIRNKFNLSGGNKIRMKGFAIYRGKLVKNNQIKSNLNVTNNPRDITFAPSQDKKESDISPGDIPNWKKCIIRRDKDGNVIK